MHELWQWMRHNPGDMATWAGALGTFLAFLAVVLPMARQRKRDQLAKRRAQAEQVAAWIEGMPRRDPLALAGRVAPAHLILRNTSQLPVYEVALAYRIDLSQVQLEGGPPYSPDIDRRVLWVELLPPGEWIVDGEITPTWEDGSIAVSFVDAAGVAWTRANDFRLKELSHPPLESYGIDPSHHTREAITRRD